jgi:carboxylesterase type B
MVSPQAKGLFKRAIPMSGVSFIKTWTFAARKDLTERLAMALGWDGTGGEKKILDVLEAADGKDMLKAETKLLTSEEIFAEHILFPFTPTVEPYETPSSFLPKDPEEMARDAWSNDIDCMLGGTSLEGGLMAMYGESFHDHFATSDSFTPLRVLGLDQENPLDSEKISAYGEKLKRFYFADKSPSAETRHQYLMVDQSTLL